MREKVVVALGAAMMFVAFACNDTFRFDEPTDGGAEGSSGATRGPCTTDVACTLPGLRCNAATGRCVACVGDSDCAAPNPRCVVNLGICVPCLGTSDCTAKQRCDSVTSTCLDTCVSDQDPCPIAGYVCSDDQHLCIECQTNANCAGNPHGTRCDPDVGRCVQCLGNAQCPAERPRCDRRIGACVGCLASTECPEGEACDPKTSTCAVLP